MTHLYNISGITCNGCVARVKNELLKIGEITEANVRLSAPQATLTMQTHVPVPALQAALKKAGDFTITEADGGMHQANADAAERSWFETHKPILLIFFYLSLITIITATSPNGFNLMQAMRIFMSGFFLTFSFFKLLDLKGFADNYASYDIMAKIFPAWGYLYAFIELLLGVAYAVNFNPLLTNCVTCIVMGLSIVGVLQSVLQKKKIRCACLGAVFNLPMSTVTIIEDALMIAMSAVMILTTLS